MKKSSILVVFAFAAVSCLGAPAHMQGTRGLTVVLEVVEQKTGVAVKHATVVYTLEKNDARDAFLPRRFAPFSKRIRFRFRTDDQGRFKVKAAFHFSTYLTEQPPYRVEFLSCLGSFLIQYQGRWIERSLSKDTSSPLFIQWIDTVEDPMNPSDRSVGDLSEEEKPTPNHAPDRMPGAGAPGESGRH